MTHWDLMHLVFTFQKNVSHEKLKFFGEVAYGWMCIFSQWRFPCLLVIICWSDALWRQTEAHTPQQGMKKSWRTTLPTPRMFPQGNAPCLLHQNHRLPENHVSLQIFFFSDSHCVLLTVMNNVKQAWLCTIKNNFSIHCLAWVQVTPKYKLVSLCPVWIPY